MLVVPVMTPAVQASLLDAVRALMSVMPVAGAVVFVLGAILYLCLLRRDRVEAVCRSRQGSSGPRNGDGCRERPASASGNALSAQMPTADNSLFAGQVKGTLT